jgi:hypothetical protein
MCVDADLIILDRGEIVNEAAKSAITLDQLTQTMMEIAKGNHPLAGSAG